MGRGELLGWGVHLPFQIGCIRFRKSCVDSKPFSTGVFSGVLWSVAANFEDSSRNQRPCQDWASSPEPQRSAQLRERRGSTHYAKLQGSAFEINLSPREELPSPDPGKWFGPATLHYRRKTILPETRSERRSPNESGPLTTSRILPWNLTLSGRSQ